MQTYLTVLAVFELVALCACDTRKLRAALRILRTHSRDIKAARALRAMRYTDVRRSR